ncbi:gluconolactonase [Aspergillus minisclerotigenes]|uniref:Gluconolactonase n=1 Tax=Aspergillus minisclerotigenes TaxID=656917 RepID=A0A5N6IYC4_9EURO|nr:gluconolactonase [Aspergillus minisclerotigenes]
MADVRNNLPTIVQAVEWTSLPQNFRRRGLSEHSINQKRWKPLDSFLEGPIYVSTLDFLFVTDIPYGRIFSIDSNANWTLVTEYDGEPNGLQGILELDPTSREIQTIASRYQGERLKGPNDLVITADGVIYFTDQGMTGLQDPTGRVFRLYPDGRLQLIVSNGPSPNGLVLSRDEKALFVAMTRDNAVWYVPLLSDGSVQRIGRFSSYYGIGGPDGMAQDAEGNVLVAHSTLGTVVLGGGVHTTNLTWGGPSMNVLYIVESETATILKVDWHCQGWLMKRAKE